MKKRVLALVLMGILIVVNPETMWAEEFIAEKAETFNDGMETDLSEESVEFQPDLELIRKSAEQEYNEDLEFSDEEAMPAEETIVDWPYEPTYNLELNKYHNVKDMEVWDNSMSSGSKYYLFKMLIPENGRIRIMLEDCDERAFIEWFSIKYSVFKYWWKTGTESYDSGWITVKPGIMDGDFINGEGCSEVNREAKLIIKYEKQGEYSGECEDNDTYDTANIISSGVVYEGDTSKERDVDVYKFHMPEAGLADISLLNKKSENSCEGTLYEEDENGNVYELLEIENSEHVRLNAGNYFVKTSGSSQYTLCVDLNGESADAYEHEDNNVKSLANERVPNTWYTGNLNTSKDIDYFRFDIENESDVALEFKVPRELEEKSIKISLYDEELNLLESAENTENPYLCTENKRRPKGIYYVRVERGTGYETFIGDYSFNFKQEEFILVQEIKIQNQELKVGEEFTMVPQILPENAINKKVEWYSTNYDIVFINSKGIITAKKPGKAQVYAVSCDEGHVEGWADIIVRSNGNVSTLKYSSVKSAEYTGKSICPSVKITDANRTLIKNVDYKITYKNNKNIGTASLVVTGIGEYTGTKTIKFNITPKRPVISSVSQSGTGRLKAAWKKVSGAHGYVLYRSTSANGKYYKIKTITSGSLLSYTNSGLKSGIRYYYKVRAYRKVNGKNYYSGYSKAKYGTTKKVAVSLSGTYKNSAWDSYNEAEIKVYKSGSVYYAKLYARGGRMNTTVRIYKYGENYRAYYSGTGGDIFFEISDISTSKIYVDFQYIDGLSGWYYKN